jgi:methylphosphotriester-DNA--protein-cysteine methyltransferase
VRQSEEKRPRQYAAEIVALKTREERAQKLTEVPEHLRELVKKHVELTFKQRKTWK